MRVDVTNQPSYAIAYVKMAAGESILSEPGALVACSAGVSVSTTAPGGVVRSLLRKTLVDESFFQVRYEAQQLGAWVALAPRFPGDVCVIDMSEEMRVQSGSMLAHESSVTTAAAGSLSTVLMREGITLICASGAGKLLLAAYGGIDRFQLGPGESMIVDTGHLVAWSASVSTQVGPLAGPVASGLSGEWLVARVTGPGLVLVQSRCEQQLRSWLLPDRRHNTG